MAKLGKKYLDKNGLSYLWKRIDGRYVHVETNDDGTYKTGFTADEIIVGINGSNGVKCSGVTIGGATLSTNPSDKVVATEKAVAAEIETLNGKIEDLGSVMSFLGVTTTDITTGTAKTTATVKIGGVDVKASNGDVVIFNTKENEPEEFIWTQTGEDTGVWQEIGKVFNDEAITAVVGSDAIDVSTTNGTSTVSLTLDDTSNTAGTEAWVAAESGYGHIHLTQSTAGLKAEYGREVVTVGDSMVLSDINDAISQSSKISWNGTGWSDGFSDYATA